MKIVQSCSRRALRMCADKACRVSQLLSILYHEQVVVLHIIRGLILVLFILQVISFSFL